MTAEQIVLALSSLGDADVARVYYASLAELQERDELREAEIELSGSPVSGGSWRDAHDRWLAARREHFGEEDA